MLPITIPGTLYGQNVTVTDLDLYFVGGTLTDGISAVVLRRQTGVCGSTDTPVCYDTLLDDPANYFCEDNSAHETGCTRHWDLSTNNVLTSTSGILSLTIELTFSGAAGWVDIGGVRLTLKHE